MTDLKKPEIREAAKRLAVAAKADIILMSGPCFPELEQLALPVLRERAKVEGRPKNVIWVLTTPGGIPEVAYRVSRAIQATYEQTTALIGGWCKSAGTLCVISASEVVMSEVAELGPLDVQLARRDELDERDSGLVIDEALDNLERHAFGFFDAFMRQIKDGSNGLVTLKMASEISANITKGLFEPIYRQVDPQKIGEVARSMAVGKAYAMRLNMPHRNLRPRALQNLLAGYPSHGFVIDFAEAKFIFNRVRSPTEAEADLLDNLGGFAIHPKQEATFELIENEVIDDAKPLPQDTSENKPRTPSRSQEKSPASKQPNRRVRVDGGTPAKRTRKG